MWQTRSSDCTIAPKVGGNPRGESPTHVPFVYVLLAKAAVEELDHASKIYRMNIMQNAKAQHDSNLGPKRIDRSKRDGNSEYALKRGS